LFSSGSIKWSKSSSNNARNGTTEKTIRSSFGQSVIQVPRDRDSSFNPMIVPKGQSMIDGLENVIVLLYAKDMSNSDIEKQISEVYNFDISISAISRITDAVTNEIVIW